MADINLAIALIAIGILLITAFAFSLMKLGSIFISSIMGTAGLVSIVIGFVVLGEALGI